MVPGSVYQSTARAASAQKPAGSVRLRWKTSSYLPITRSVSPRRPPCLALGQPTRQSISPCTTANHPSWWLAQACHPSAILRRSSAVAWPPPTALAAYADWTVRSAHRPPHQARSSGVAYVQVDDDAVTSVSPAALAQACSRRPASGSPPLPRVTRL